MNTKLTLTIVKEVIEMQRNMRKKKVRASRKWWKTISNLLPSKE